MHLHLILPGLIWPAVQTAAPAAALDLPALARLLGHARLRSAPPADTLGCVLTAFGQNPDGVSIAQLRRLGEDLPPPAADAHCLCADPVNLRFAREHLILADASTLSITPAEAQALVDALNTVFSDLGRFEMGSAERWYLYLRQPARARFTPLAQATGRPVARCLPEGEDAREWQRLNNEAQIVLHNHPINRNREQAGLPLINSLWLWGAGSAPAGLRPPAALQALAPELRGLARAAGLQASPPEFAAALATPTLSVLDTLARPALHLDLDAWRNALTELERDWCAPLLAALRAGRLKTLRITAPGERATLDLNLAARDLWKFWQRPRSLDALHKTLP